MTLPRPPSVPNASISPFSSPEQYDAPYSTDDEKYISNRLRRRGERTRAAQTRRDGSSAGANRSPLLPTEREHIPFPTDTPNLKRPRGSDLLAGGHSASRMSDIPQKRVKYTISQDNTQEHARQRVQFIALTSPRCFKIDYAPKSGWVNDRVTTEVQENSYRPPLFDQQQRPRPGSLFPPDFQTRGGPR